MSEDGMMKITGGESRRLKHMPSTSLWIWTRLGKETLREEET
jgi:hypothetical protein